MAIRFISDLVGTFSTYFRISTVRLKNNSNVLEIKNVADNAFYPGKMSSLHLPGATSGLITITAPAIAGTQVYEFPGDDGTTGQVLTSDGSGILTWTSVATGSTQVKSEVELISHGDASPTTIFTPPASAHIQKVIVDVETVWDGTTPSMSVGIAGTVSQYMTTAQIDLTTIGIYEVEPMFEEDGTPDAIIVTFVAGAGHTTGTARVTVEYANPG